MQQHVNSSKRTTPGRKFLRILLPGTGFGLLLFAFVFFNIDDMTYNFARWALYFLVLYLLVPFLPSMYLTQRSGGDTEEGQETTLFILLTGIILGLLAIGIYTWAWFPGYGNSTDGPSPMGFYVKFVLLNMLGFLVSFPGAILGCKLGKRKWRETSNM